MTIPEITADTPEPVDVPIPKRPDMWLVLTSWARWWEQRGCLYTSRGRAECVAREVLDVAHRRIVKIPGEG